MTGNTPTSTPDHVAVLAEEVASATGHRGVFRAVFLFCTRLTPADAIFVSLFEPGSQLRRCVYAAGVVDGPDAERLLEEDEDLSIYPPAPLNDSPQSRAMSTGQIVNVPDFDAGARGLPRTDTGSDFDEKPPRSSVAVPLVAWGSILGAFEVQSTRKAAFDESHFPYLRMAARLAAIAVHNLELNERERAQHEASLRALGLALEHRDYETKGHTDRVVQRSLALGRRLGLESERLRSLRWGAYLHDVGKLAIPDEILLKPGKLSEAKFRVIERHTLVGLDICLTIPFLAPDVVQVVRSHHERWDGGGYPDGLRGEQIPLLARLFSIVDVYDALTHERPYKGAWPREQAAAYLQEQAGLHFDPSLVGEFLSMLEAESLLEPQSPPQSPQRGNSRA